MSRRALLLQSIFWLVVPAVAGCASGPFAAKKEKLPDGNTDKWAIAGREGRANRPIEKEDPLDRLLWSEKAREINRNVGYE